MDTLNYHHLYYFWMVAREGSIASACELLSVAQPTISTQLRLLERSLGVRLFSRKGRGLALTEAGRVTYRHADEIFSIGRDLQDAVSGRAAGHPLRLSVGVIDAMPKLVVYQLLEPALHLTDPVRIVCTEGKVEDLLGDLARHRLDIVLSDTPIAPGAAFRAYNHLLGECGVSIFGATERAGEIATGFPGSLHGEPMLLPVENSTLRRSFDHWFNAKGIRPKIVGEFVDSALMKAFGQAGAGLFPGPTVIEGQVCQQYGVSVVGRIDTVRRAVLCNFN